METRRHAVRDIYIKRAPHHVPNFRAPVYSGNGKPTPQDMKREERHHNPVQDRRNSGPMRRLKNKAAAPKRFKLTIGSDSRRFHDSLQVDRMFLNGRLVLHMVVICTHFCTAGFMRSQMSKDVRGTMQILRSFVYLGPADHLNDDRGSNYISRTCLLIWRLWVQSCIKHRSRDQVQSLPRSDTTHHSAQRITALDPTWRGKRVTQTACGWI